MTKILGIESTCDESAAAVVDDGRIVVSNVIASQQDLHKKYGGVVPEVASRKHLEMLPVVVKEALEQAKTTMDEIEAIAVAKEPGLPPALSVGFAYASGLATSMQKKLIPVNHLEAHVSSVWVVEDKKDLFDIPYPYLCLLVSGGHSELRLITSNENQKILGRTKDDAAGEAFDKVARLLELRGYPGGPIIDTLAREGDEAAHDLPRPMMSDESFDFSFSGLKTAVGREVEKLEKEHEAYKDNDELHKELKNNWTRDIAASFQEAVVDVLVSKTIAAAQHLEIETIALAGGVSANSRLRDKMGRICKEMDLNLYYPELKYCVDNAAMIAARGHELL